MTLKKAIKVRATRGIARRRQNVLLAKLAHYARVYGEMYENVNYEWDSNGESWLLRRMSTVNPGVIFDVGANIGDWTAEALATSGGAEIHSFELVPETAAGLRARFRANHRVKVNAVGLLGEPGSVRVKYYPEFPPVSSVKDFPQPLDYEWIEADAMRGDDYCVDAAIEHIDLLKIDAEGADHLVLAGFDRMLSTGAVDVVQFEYDRAAISSRFLLADFHELLEGKGMVIGKLLPDSVDFRPYDIYRDENFLGPNYVAVKESRRDLQELLSGR